MQSLAAGLPPDIAVQIHPTWRKNEADYWAAQGQLLSQYRNEWIAFADGKVIAASTSPVEVFRKAHQSGLHPFVVCVGREYEPCRMRRTEFSYDASYPDEALPVVSVEFRTDPDCTGIVMDDVIPDTGADASALPWSDCQQLNLDPADGIPGLISGVGQSSASTIVFFVWAHLDGENHPCRVQADFHGNERLLGRDVLNRLDILFRGPSGQVVVNP
jgi:hypothetical protein